MKPQTTTPESKPLKLSDKQKEGERDYTMLIWKSHVRNLFDEILINKDCLILHKPLQITIGILGEMASHAAKSNDEKMIGYFCRLALYTFSDPTNPDYDKERTDYYINKTTKP